jgi:hypothetical protein
MTQNNTMVVNENLAFVELNGKNLELACGKRALVWIAENTTGGDLKYDTILAGGKVEVQDGILPPNFSFTVAKGGETYGLVDKKGRNIRSKVYANTPLSAEEAMTEAGKRGLALTLPRTIDAALTLLAKKNPGLDLSKLKGDFYESLGRCVAFRLPADVTEILVPKKAWSSVQKGDGKAVLIVNLLTNECYLIGWDEFVENWFIEAQPDLTGDEMMSKLPVLTGKQSAAITVTVPEGKTPEEVAQAMLA